MNVQPWGSFGAGESGRAVVGIQRLLREHGHSLTVDGTYGPVTAAEVASFQADRGLAVDGVVGMHTWPVLVVPTRVGDTGEAVRAVQQFGLVRFPGDPELVIDGVFGPLTAERVRFFQESWGLTIDGTVGPETWSFLGVARLPWPLVKVGTCQETNWRVLGSQHLLRQHGAPIVADGLFGP